MLGPSMLGPSMLGPSMFDETLSASCPRRPTSRLFSTRPRYGPPLSPVGKPLLSLIRLQPNRCVINFCRHTTRFTNGRRKKDALLANTKLIAKGVDMFDGLVHFPNNRYMKAAFLGHLSHKRLLRRFTALGAATRQEAALRRLEDGDTAFVVGDEAIGTRAGIVLLTWLPGTKLRDVAVSQFPYHPSFACSSPINFWLPSWKLFIPSGNAQSTSIASRAA